MTVETVEHAVQMNHRRMVLDPKPKLSREDKILSMGQLFRSSGWGHALFLPQSTPRTMKVDNYNDYDVVLIAQEIVSEHRWMYIDGDRSLTPVSRRPVPVFLLKCLLLRYTSPWGEPIIESERVYAPEFKPRAGTTNSRKTSYRKRVQKKWNKRFGGERLVHSAQEVYVIMGSIYVQSIGQILDSKLAAAVDRPEGGKFPPPYNAPRFDPVDFKRFLSPIK